MTNRHRHPLVVSIFIGIGTAVVGCASVKDSIKAPFEVVENVTEERKERRAEAERRFGSQRDLAEFEAAKASRKQGNTRAATELLGRLLARNPDHREAQALLADIQTQSGQSPTPVAQFDPRNGPERLTYPITVVEEDRPVASPYPETFQPTSALQPGNYAPSYGQDSASNVPTERVTPVGYYEQPDSASPPSTGSLTDLFAWDPIVSSDGSAERDLSSVPGNRPDQADSRHIPFSQAVEALQANQPEVAVSLLEPLAGASGSSPGHYRVLATAHYRRGDYDSAQVALKHALSLDNSNALSYFLMGCVLEKLGQFEAADQHFVQAERIDPSYASRH